MAEPLAVQAYDSLKRDIIAGSLAPGDMVLEGELAGRYGMSKTPIREALSLLANEGFVQIVPRRGTIITPISLTDIQHTFFLRMLLEPEAAALAARRILPDELAALEALLAEFPQQPAAGAESMTWMLGSHQLFHRGIADASGVPPLARMIVGVLEKVTQFYNSHPNIPHVGHANHRDLLDALRDHDPETARSLVADGIRLSRQRLLDSLVQDPTQFVSVA